MRKPFSFAGASLLLIVVSAVPCQASLILAMLSSDGVVIASDRKASRDGQVYAKRKVIQANVYTAVGSTGGASHSLRNVTDFDATMIAVDVVKEFTGKKPFPEIVALCAERIQQKFRILMHYFSRDIPKDLLTEPMFTTRLFTFDPNTGTCTIGTIRAYYNRGNGEVKVSSTTKELKSSEIEETGRTEFVHAVLKTKDVRYDSQRAGFAAAFATKPPALPSKNEVRTALVYLIQETSHHSKEIIPGDASVGEEGDVCIIGKNGLEWLKDF
jgi:hypothetical protein